MKSEGESGSVVSDSLQPHGLNSPWSSPGQNTEVGSLSFLQGIFPTLASNQGLLHGKWILYQLSHRGSWWKGKFALLWMPATRVGKGSGEGGEGGVGKKFIQSLTPLHCQSVGKNFYRQREGAAWWNSTVSSDSLLEIGHHLERWLVRPPSWNWTGQHHLYYVEVQLVNLQFQGWFVSISLNFSNFSKLQQLMSWLWQI